MTEMLALRRLGCERARRALAAFDHPVNMWTQCLLARAYGEPGALWADMLPHLQIGVMKAAAACLEIPVGDVQFWCTQFDREDRRTLLKRRMEAFIQEGT